MGTRITPAPGYVLVIQNRSTGGVVGGQAIAAKENALHEGIVVAIGYVPKRYRMNLRAGDLITFARFNAVKVSGVDEDYLAVSMQHIVCKKEDAEFKGGWWRRAKAWLGLSLLGASFAAGYFANDAWAWIKENIRK